MQKFLDLLIWFFWRPWHIWVPLVFVFFSYLSARRWEKRATTIYKFVSMFMQLIGVMILVYLLNQNIFAIKNTTFTNEIYMWAVENPFNKKDATVKLEGISGFIGFSGMNARIKRVGKTSEEKIAILEEELEALRREVKDEDNRIIKIINESKADTDAKINDINTAYGKLNILVEKVVIGDYRVTVFSSLMLIFGLTLSVFPIRQSTK